MVIHDFDTSANEINNDLYQINKWAFQCKMSFNPDLSKQAQEVIFSRKAKKISHPSLRFNNTIAPQTPYQKHIGIFLDARLTFDKQLRVVTTNENKTIGLLHQLQKILPRLVLMTICKALMRPQLGYGVAIYDEVYYSIKCLSSPIRGSLRKKTCQEFGLKSLQPQRWYRFYQIYK